ncbi:MAG: diadenylate cyclase [Patescibacteria group bacterium]
MPRRILKQILEIVRLAKRISQFGLFTKKEQENLSFVFSDGEKDGISPGLKLKVYEIILLLRSRIKRPFGLLVVLGWQREWNEKYAAISDIDQDIFRNHHFDLGKHSLNQCTEAIKKTIDFDGAILVNKEGIILGSGAYLENVRPKEVSKIVHSSDHTKDLSEAFGFAKKVHTRHLAAIAASYRLKNTTVFVLSEEDGSVRIFERGKIVWSTIPSEIQRIIESQ